MAFIIKRSPTAGTDLLIPDLGYPILVGGTITLTEIEDIRLAQESENLRTFLTDDNFGVGDSSLRLNDGTADIPQANVLSFLDQYDLFGSNGDPYSVVKLDGTGKIPGHLISDGNSELIDWKLGSDLDVNGNEIVGLPAIPSGPTASTSKDYVDNLFSTSISWRERVLDPIQLLGGATGAILQASVFYLVNQPAVGDFLTIEDGTAPRTYEFGSLVSGDVQVTIGANADDTMTNLAAAVSGDVAQLWSGLKITTLESINAGAGSSSAGHVVLLYRRAQGVDSYDDRLFGTFATPANAKYVNFNGEADYGLSTNTNLPAADPAQKKFGFGRARLGLIGNETHTTRTDDRNYTWNEDDELWNDSGSSTVNKVCIDFGAKSKVKESGIAYLKSLAGKTSIIPVRMIRSGTITGAVVEVDKIDSSRSYKLSIKINAVEVASLALAINTIGNETTILNVSFSAGDKLSVSMERTTGSGTSKFKYIWTCVEVAYIA